MSRLAIPLAASFALLCSLLLAYAARQVDAPAALLVPEATACDHGRIGWTTIRGSMSIANRGAESVSVSRVTKSCDCADVRVPMRPIAPGDRVLVGYDWDTRGKRGKTETTISIVYRSVGSNIENVLPVVISGDVLPDYDFSPATVSLSNNARSSVSVDFTGADAAFHLKSASSSHPAVETAIASTKRSVRLTLLPDKAPEEDWVPISVKIVTTSSAAPVCTIPVMLRNR